MAQYKVWHPRFMPEDTITIEDAFNTGLEWIRQVKQWGREEPWRRFPTNNVTITREDLPRPVVVAFVRGRNLE